MIQGTNTATTTDLDGKFSLMCPSGNIVLFASCLGYKDQSVRIWNSDNIRIVMEPDMEVLEEAVAIGYGTMKKSDLTGAVSSIKVDDGNVSSVTSVTNILAGKAAGLEVSMGSANPGAGATFRIRGAASVNSSNDPLIIIDGFPISPSADSDIAVGDYDTGSSDNVFGSINPNDIASIEVLKDASSTAIYGARAANGVIIVTTKRGSSGAPKVTYSGSGGISVMAKRYEMMDATELMNAANTYAYERWMLDNGVGIYGGKAPEDVIKPYIPYYTDDQIAANQYDTDWFDEISRIGYQTQHNISIKVGRIFNTYGPKMHPHDGRVVSNFIIQALQGEPITIYGNGEQTRSFCYVDDLIECMVRFMQTPDDFIGPMNMGNPGEFTIRELAEKVVELTGSSSKIVYEPLPGDDPRQRRPNIDLARKMVGWL